MWQMWATGFLTKFRMHYVSGLWQFCMQINFSDQLNLAQLKANLHANYNLDNSWKELQ